MSFPSADQPAPQLSLFGEAPSRPSDRLFFAVLPDPTAAAGIAALARQLAGQFGLRARPRPSAHFHITLHHLGDYVGLPADLVRQACEAGGALRAAPFDVCFDSAGSFQGRASKAPFVLRGGSGLLQLTQLQSQLGRCMAAAGMPRLVEQRFVPHLTLLYDSQRVPPQPVPALSWRVDNVALVHSLLGRTEYRLLARWPLLETAGGTRPAEP